MKQIRVDVQNDHLARMAAVRKPILAVAELVWNALDAEATEVRVELSEGELGALETVSVCDNGHGIAYDEAEPAFRNLGGSWKSSAGRSRSRQRLLHGRAGKGRFRAFAIGGDVTWETRYRANGVTKAYRITGSSPDLATFAIEDPADAPAAEPGTTVMVSRIDRNLPSLRGPAALQEFTGYFALYMHQYPGVQISYDGAAVDAKSVQAHEREYTVGPVTLSDGRTEAATLIVVEWRVEAERAMYLCDAAGFPIERVPPGIHAPGYQFTAYLKAEVLRELEEQGRLSLAGLDPDVNLLLVAARERLREHFRQRAAGAAVDLVARWKQERVYPFEGEASTPIETATRQVFDVVALNVSSYVTGFEDADEKSRRLSFRLLRQALENSPRTAQRIIAEVLDLPQDKQRDLAELLETTSLTAIINAAKTVADRLDFIRSLEVILFRDDLRERLLERTQLHRLLESYTWIFGEEFALTVSDRSLTDVLRSHLALLDRDELCPEPVRRSDGSIGIVDLMLSRSVPQPRAEEREHLVVELKRPSQPIDARAAQQVQSYALAVAEDERFRDTATRWVFWALSNDVSEDVRRLSRQRNRPAGVLYEDADQRLVVWVKSWGEVIQECRGRLRFFQEHLEYSPGDEIVLARLRAMHEKYLPALAVGGSV